MSGSGSEWIRGKNCVVTGGSSGIGFETARGLAKLGAHLLLVARDPEKLATAARIIRGEAGVDSVETVRSGDLAEQSEVRRACRELLDRGVPLHVLVNNAGAMFTRRLTTSEGVERTFALNVVAPFLFSALLSGRLEESAPARIVMVASSAHRWARRIADGHAGPDRYSGFREYARSKLALILLTHELAKRLKPYGISVNALHPGFVATRFGQNIPGPAATGMALLERLFGTSPERGARTPVYAASSTEAGAVSGAYFVRSRVRRSSQLSYDPRLSSPLLSSLEQLTHEPMPGEAVATERNPGVQ